jgi:hypothetical protein
MLSIERENMLTLLTKWMGRRQLTRVCCVLLLAMAAGSAHGQSAEEREQALKAGFLFNFFSYVDWQKPDKNEGAFVLGIVGDETFAAANKALSGKMAKGRRIEVRKVDDFSKLSMYHLVFVSASEERRAREIINQAQASGVLTVGEGSSFLHEGGVINLVPAHNNFRIEINPTNAEKAGLTISSQLLKLARIDKG